MHVSGFSYTAKSRQTKYISWMIDLLTMYTVRGAKICTDNNSKVKGQALGQRSGLGEQDRLFTTFRADDWLVNI